MTSEKLISLTYEIRLFIQENESKFGSKSLVKTLMELLDVEYVSIHFTSENACYKFISNHLCDNFYCLDCEQLKSIFQAFAEFYHHKYMSDDIRGYSETDYNYFTLPESYRDCIDRQCAHILGLYLITVEECLSLEGRFFNDFKFELQNAVMIGENTEQIKKYFCEYLYNEYKDSLEFDVFVKRLNVLRECCKLIERLRDNLAERTQLEDFEENYDLEDIIVETNVLSIEINLFLNGVAKVTKNMKVYEAFETLAHTMVQLKPDRLDCLIQMLNSLNKACLEFKTLKEEQYKDIGKEIARLDSNLQAITSGYSKRCEY